MAWIEAHQTLRRHPKALHLASILRVPTVTAVGHLLFLWWWAVDYAADGDLSRFDDRTLAEAADWRKAPEMFVTALTDAGWLDSDRHVHDWMDYAGRLVQKRKANAERMREARASDDTGHVQRTSNARAGATVPDLTEPTEPDQTEPDLTVAPERRDEVFEALAESCGIKWRNLTPSARGALNQATKALREAGDATPNEIRFRAEAYRLTYPTMALTPSALAKHWPSLAGGVRHTGRVMSTADRMAMDLMREVNGDGAAGSAEVGHDARGSLPA